MTTELTQFLLGAGFNLFVTLLIVRGVYYPVTQDKNFVFTFIGFNMIIYFVLGFLTSVEVGVGVGFGLFAIFSLLRYRTDEIPIREMTYLFILIALGVMNSLMHSGSLLQIGIANSVILVILFVLEKGWGFQFEANKRVAYDKIELIGPDRSAELLADLRQRTGILVKRVEIGRIDLLHDMADLKIFYDETPRLSANHQPTNPRVLRDQHQLP
ncbi:DUF4956 domain-containing protein [Herpetosiphon geysericola]|uniref:DUF4956 domain-containing protein n=1 Tax=Herpetosiphon geysericola TaxID=70996 RepID=A0A0P6YLQ9_9CHLR|nr:DUF4956 domain-containing protein [Herpetosiphon geysericola]KPL90996.1 hypothetical protein SE18_04345 [Herpetosiphon geysericola]